MNNSFKLSAKHYAVFAFLLLVPLLVSASGEETSSITFSEDFEGSEVDAAKWVVLENTNLSGYPAYGGSVNVADGYLSLSSNGSSFPWVYTASNPFPETGDFTVEFNLTYTCVGDSGNGVMISTGMPTLDSNWHNKIVTLWAHDEGPDHGVVYMEFFNSLVYRMNIPGFKPSSPPHSYKVTYAQGNYTIYVDGVNVATTQSQQRPTMIGFGNPPNPEVPQSPQTVAEWGYWGWSSFKVDSIKVEAAVNNDTTPHTTQVSVSTATEMQQLGYKIGIKGNLTSEGKPVSDARIILSYSLPGVSTWQPIASVTTNQLGAYSASWIPTATGEFTIKAEYAGDQNYAGSFDVKNISVLESTSKDLFFVESNSTLSSLAFNSTSEEVSFAVSGPSGTTGYVKFIVSKQLVPDASSLKVYLDNTQIEYTVSSVDDAWLLYFAYPHSTHTITIRMPRSPDVFSSYSLALAAVISASAIAPGLLVYYFKKRKK